MQKRGGRMRRFATMGVLGLGWSLLLPASTADAYSVFWCKTANSYVSYQRSTTELAGRDYLALAAGSAQDWTNAGTPVSFHNDITTGRDVLLGGLYYGSDLGGHAVTNPNPACYYTYGGVWPQTYTYIRLNLSDTDPWPSSRVRYTFNHEMGHLLGLAHPDTDACTNVTVMLISDVGYVTCGLRGIQQDDVNGVNYNY